MKTSTHLLLLALLGLAAAGPCYGTHITGGEITAMRDANSSNPYAMLFTLNIYRDRQGVDQPNATLDFGVDGATQTVQVGQRLKTGQSIGNNNEVLVYQFKYTYPGPGTYTVSFTEENRNAGVVNMFQSVNTAFHIQTAFALSPSLGLNSTPVFLNAPIFRATVGKKLCINPAAYDSEGDSLTYRLAVPFEKRGSAIGGYLFPSQVTPLGTPESGSGAPTLTLDPITGDMCWDAPGPRKWDGGVITSPTDFAQYAVAVAVEEWRNGNKISTTLRDFQITVTGPEEANPELRLQNAEESSFNADRRIRVEPGEALSFSVLYKDPAAARDTLLVVSETLLQPVKASVTYSDSAGFTKATYSWIPAEANRRGHPYVVVFRGGSAYGDSSRLFLNDLTFAVFVGAAIPTGRVTATEDELGQQKITLFPNPTRGKVRLGRLPNGGPIRLQLWNLLGEEMYSALHPGDTDFEPDLSALPDGLYVYMLSTRNRIVGKGKLLKR